MMNAVRIHEFGGPEVLVYEPVEQPTVGPEQVLVQIKAAAVNQIDVSVREDQFPTPLGLPKTLGSDGAGVVAEVGSSVADVHIGDEVLFTGLGVGSQGSYADYAVIAPVQAVPKPPSLSFPEAAAMGLVFPTAYYGLTHRAHVQPDETVLVQGAAGGVGSAAVQLARVLGARVIAVVSDPDETPQVRDLGVQDIIDRSADEVPKVARELTDGRGVDVIIEIATTDNLPADLDAIAKGGRIVCIGQGTSQEAHIPVGKAIGEDATLLFMSVSNAKRAGIAAMLREIGELAERGAVHPVVGATFPLREARAAHEMLADKHFGKIVLLP